MIEVRELTSRRGGTRVLAEVSLAIDDGEWVVIAGPNGAGKTTLVRHFNALLRPESGAVLVDGTPAAENPVAARTAVGMVFQRPDDQFVASTVGADVAFGPENLGLDRASIDQRVRTALDAVGMAERGDEAIRSLSGGERARVAIAGALAMRPSHLVLDEPFRSLDVAARESVLARLDDLAANGTGVVVVTHDLRGLLERADRLVVLRDGAVAMDGEPASVADRLDRVDVPFPC
ncbi:MAG: energy-coupling factor ABC transporter ATP-binding protein [Halanaeroarchaeum sp.]